LGLHVQRMLYLCRAEGELEDCSDLERGSGLPLTFYDCRGFHGLREGKGGLFIDSNTKSFFGVQIEQGLCSKWNR